MADSLSRRQAIGIGAAVAGAAVAAPVIANVALAGTSASESVPAAGAGFTITPNAIPVGAQKIIAETKEFTPGSKNVDAVKDFGAKGDGKTDNTATFAAAIKAVNASPDGGTVNVPAGTYVTGAIQLLSNVNFHLAAGATLKFSGDKSKFPIVLTRYEGIECMNYSPMIYAFGQKNIALTGSGTLDAGGTSSWNKGNNRKFLESWIKAGRKLPSQRKVPGSGNSLRVAFVEPYNCDTVLIQGVKLKNPMFWQLHPTLSKNVIIDGVTTDPSTSHSNTDGCDPESSDHVLIRNCTLGAHDDNVAIKSGRDDDGRRINVPTSNVVIYNCLMNGNWGAITCGSEQTGGIKNVYAFKCHIIGATKFALYVKSNTQRGGFSQNINLESFTGNPTRSYVFVLPTYNGQTGSHPFSFGPFHLKDCNTTKVPKVFDVSGTSSSHVHGFTADTCTFKGVSNTSNTFKNVDGLVLTNVTINGKTVTK